MGGGGKHLGVGVGDRAGGARPGQQGQVVGHVAEREDRLAGDPEVGRDLGHDRGLGHAEGRGLDQPLAVGVGDADQVADRGQGQREQVVAVVPEMPAEQLGRRPGEQRRVARTRHGLVDVPVDRLVELVGGVPVRVLDRDPDAGHRRAQRRGGGREHRGRDQMPRRDRVGLHVVGQRPVRADGRSPVPEHRRDLPHPPRRPPGHEHEPGPGRLHPGEGGDGPLGDRPVAADDRPIQIGRHQQREVTHTSEPNRPGPRSGPLAAGGFSGLRAGGTGR